MRSVWRQKEKEEDQRGQGWDFGNCLRCEREQEVRVRSNGGMERERGIVRVKRVAMSMFAIRRVPIRPELLILRVSVYNDFCGQLRQKSSLGYSCLYFTFHIFYLIAT